jgi:DNA-binding NtrC family response regulator
MQHNWPGNVRELENTIERMTLLHQGAGVLDLADLPPKLRSYAKPTVVPIRAELSVAPTPTSALESTETPGAAAPPLAPADFRLPIEGIDLRAAVEEFEMNLIDQALARTNGNKNQAARLLGLNRTTLVEKLRKRRGVDRDLGDLAFGTDPS